MRLLAIDLGPNTLVGAAISWQIEICTDAGTANGRNEPSAGALWSHFTRLPLRLRSSFGRIYEFSLPPFRPLYLVYL